MASSSRSDLLRMGAVIVLLLAITGGLLLATSGGSDDGGASRLASVDGRLISVGNDQLVLSPNGGGSPQTFDLRPIDARRLDLLHLQQHMAQQLPSRVFYEEEGASRFAVRVDDLPPG